MNEPVTAGIPFPKGVLNDASFLHLSDSEIGNIPLQTCPLAFWPDRSLKWVLLDFQVSIHARSEKQLELTWDKAGPPKKPKESISIEESENDYRIDTKTAIFFVNKSIFKPFGRVLTNGIDIINGAASKALLATESGEEFQPFIENIFVETKGALRSTVKVEGSFANPAKLKLARFFSRINFFANSSMVKMEFTILNPKAAKHPGGLWDLGDPGSIYFKDLSLHLALNAGDRPVTANLKIVEDPVPPVVGSNQGAVNSKPTAATNEQSAGNGQQAKTYSLPLTIYQDSSGGHNWKSKNHVNRNGEVKNSFRGFRVYLGKKITGEGNRANPILAVTDGERNISGAVQYFWQNFPKAMEAEGKCLTIRLFPHQYNDVFELQGGEQKTHTVFLNFGLAGSGAQCLQWIQTPLIARTTPEWYCSSGAFPYLTPESEEPNQKIINLINSAIEGENAFSLRREIIDEYGWRNFGDFYADHETLNHTGPEPMISHYNNQYDCIHGAIIQSARSGNLAWFLLADQLCRHVKDIDLYHTNSDRPEFNDGLFWHTEHYIDAETATHRCFSKGHASKRNLKAYGGGPSLSHAYTTGLLYHFYMTGDQSSCEAVLSLSSFVLNNMEMEGTLVSRSLGLFRKIRLGIKKAAGRGELVENNKVYGLDGPGRASGNSLNVLMDAYCLQTTRDIWKKRRA